MRKTITTIIVLVVLVAAAAGFYLFFPHIWGEAVYPLEYKDSIRKYSTQFGVDPNLVCAVIYTESRFHKDSTSGAGARGLMQIMPSTGAGLAERLGESGYSPDNLYDPDTSIRYGTYYLKEKLDEYNGSVEMMAAAYNAGGGRAEAWRDRGEPLPNETVGFINKIKNTKEMYDKIYGQWYNELEVKKPGPFYQGIDNMETFIRDLLTGNR